MSEPTGLPFPYSVRRHGVTITNCDAEPVQTPGCIQPHGVLLALRPGELTIAQASENSERWLGLPPERLLGRSVSEVLGDVHAARLGEFVAREPLERNPLYVLTADVQGAGEAAALDVTAHTADGVLLVEMEPAGRGRADGTPEPDYYGMVKRTVALLQATPTVRDFCQVVTEEVRRLTGLDRVMVYKFHPDHSGEVLGEAKRQDLAPWLGLRYPADDIPRPAREIFKKIWIRPLPDAAAEPAEMVPLINPDTGRPLEMTHCALRGASVMYTEYLRNMGVAASLTMSILRDGELWGLIAGHHSTPARFPFQVRAAAEFTAQVVSLQLKNAEDREHLQYRASIDAAHHGVLARAAGPGGLAQTVDGHPRLMNGIACTGAALFDGGRWWTAGAAPAEPELEALAAWLRGPPGLGGSGRPVYVTDRLAVDFPPAASYPGLAAGLLAVPVSRHGRSLILWFRREQAQTFQWAGNPHDKPTELGPNGPRLTPRRSFELWQEQVQGRSAPWLELEVDAAVKLRLLVMDLVISRTEAIATLNAELSRSNEELDAFSYAASHDLKEPLRSIHRYAHYLLEDAQAGKVLDAQATARIEALLRLTVRMDGLLDALLHFSRVGHLSLEPEDTPLNELAREALEMLGARLEESGAEVRLPRPLPAVWCDRVRVREVFANLIANALKYNDKAGKWIEIGYFEADEPAPPFVDRGGTPEAARGQRVFYVADNGIGIEPRHFDQVFRLFKRLHPREAFGGGNGAGLTITRKLVEQHGGVIWLQSRPSEGTTFLFTLSGDSPLGASGMTRS
jgi:two-component system, chemotaxis family, sensor kinase Cph1